MVAMPLAPINSSCFLGYTDTRLSQVDAKVLGYFSDEVGLAVSAAPTCPEKAELN